MAGPAEVDVSLPALPRVGALPGEQLLARVLRVGAVSAGSLFVASMALDAAAMAPAAAATRQLAFAALTATPLLRLFAASAMLFSRGELRYAAYGALTLTLLGMSLGAL